MSLIYNSQSLRCKKPFGAIKNNEKVLFTIYVPKSYNCEKPVMVIEQEGEKPCEIDGVKFSAHKSKPSIDNKNDVFNFEFTAKNTGVYVYYFDLFTNYNKVFKNENGNGFITDKMGTKWQLTVYESDFSTPDHMPASTMYQIFPDRFYGKDIDENMPFNDRIYRANKKGEPYFWPTENGGHLNYDYFGGNFKGIKEKLPYLSELGVDLLYFNPIFEAHANHRYNTADYMRADPLLGTNDDFKDLCEAAKKYGMKIILDGVFSHTGSDSLYFNREGRYGKNGAFNSEQSPYRSWYEFSERYTCGYRSWWGFETLPEVQEHEKTYREFICGENGVIDYWLKLGAGGFRLDVADELPDDFIEEIRVAVKRRGEDKILIGEVWEDATNKISYGKKRTYLLGKGLDTVMNYPFKDAVLAFCKGEDAKITARRIMDICENYPPPALNTAMNFASTHDTMRAITALAGEDIANHDRYWQSGKLLNHEQYEKGIKLLKIAYAILFTLPGVPCVYYGDEIAMQGYKDPFNRAYFDWDNNEKRVYDTIRVLSQFRKDNSAFKDGRLIFIRREKGTLCYSRKNENNAVAIGVNCNNFPVSVHLLDEDYVLEPYEFRIISNNI